MLGTDVCLTNIRLEASVSARSKECTYIGTGNAFGVQSGAVVRGLAGFAQDSVMSAIRENVTGEADGPGGSRLRELFNRQRAAFHSTVPDYAKRLASLKSLEEVVL